jgi:hypothetical protein
MSWILLTRNQRPTSSNFCDKIQEKAMHLTRLLVATERNQVVGMSDIASVLITQVGIVPDESSNRLPIPVARRIILLQFSVSFQKVIW